MNDRRLAVRLALVAFVLFLTPAAPAPAAEDVTPAELRRLAAQAERDPGARDRLAEVRRVDGRPVDLRLALDTDDEAELRDRLRTLAGGAESGPTGGEAVDAARAQEDARRILDGRDFKPARVPRPFRGALRQLGEWLQPILEPIGRLFRPIGRALAPIVGSGVAPYVALVVVLAAAFTIARRMVHRRTRAAVDFAGRGRRGRSAYDDPDALEREADAAERAGNFDGAVRFRFRAGLLRLDRAGAVEVRPSLTTGQLRSRVRSEALGDLAATFDEVAYGGRPAGPDDVAAARSQWPRVLEEAGRR